MAEKTIAGIPVKVNDEGYFEDASQWTKEIALAMAIEVNLTLSDKHFALLDFLRQKYLAGEALTIRKVGTSGIVDIKEFYQLFPGGPLKLASKLAGIPKPTSCV